MAKHELVVEQFRARFPRPFSDSEIYTDAIIGAQWEMAEALLNPYDNWLIKGNRLQLALELMTAHLTYINASPESEKNGGGAGGVVASASEGSVSVSFATPQIGGFEEAWLGQTKWGQQLLAILEQFVAGGFTLGGRPETSAIRDVGGVF